MSFGWGGAMSISGLVASMVVNAMVTGSIVFKILTVFLEVKAVMTSVERTLGSTGGSKLRHIIFVIIESGMALFAIQLIRLVFSFLPVEPAPDINDYWISIHQMFNVIIRSVSFFFFSTCFILLITFFLPRASHQQ